jgi:diguanylate cyclase (GGDEF)-like protein
MALQHSETEQLEHSRHLLEKLTIEVERNTEILRRSQERELRLLQAEDLAGLFTCMLDGLAESYGLDAMTVVLCDPDHDVRHLLLAGGASVDQFPGLLFVETLAGLTPQYVALRTPWLGPYSKSDHQLVFADSKIVRSIAIIPLRHKGRLLGSMNFGSADPSRFTPNHASDFFAHLGVIASFALENAVNRARLLRSGFTDVLTGWHNRRYLQVRIKEELARARRHDTPLSCLMLDIDHFKNVNDRFGHAAGDRVLREIAQRVESQVRATDVTARYGGEEFTILLPDTSVDSAALLAERIRHAVSATPFDVGDGQSLTVTASIGIASASPQRVDADLKTVGESLIARADVAMYRAKSAGRDRIALNTDE